MAEQQLNIQTGDMLENGRVEPQGIQDNGVVENPVEVITNSRPFDAYDAAMAMSTLLSPGILDVEVQGVTEPHVAYGTTCGGGGCSGGDSNDTKRSHQ